MNIHNHTSQRKVIKLYKKTEKSEEKIFRRGDYRTDLVLFRGGGGVSSEIFTFRVGLYSENRCETLFFVIIPNCRFIL